MTYTEIVAEIPHLSAQQRLALMQVLFRSFIEKPFTIIPSDALLELRGVLKNIVEIPTDESVHEAYKDYLETKYR